MLDKKLFICHFKYICVYGYKMLFLTKLMVLISEFVECDLPMERYETEEWVRWGPSPVPGPDAWYSDPIQDNVDFN